MNKTREEALLIRARMKEYRPIFISKNREQAFEYYKKLGFECNHYTGFMDRDDLKLTLHQLDDTAASIAPNHQVDGWSWDLYVWVDDADALYQEFVDNGAIIHYPPKDPIEYRMREFAIRDLDGYVIAFASCRV
jgi:uncharacterized glyoxalase superfamily protein PhnB